jgi:hypothetical protein
MTAGRARHGDSLVRSVVRFACGGPNLSVLDWLLHRRGPPLRPHHGSGAAAVLRRSEHGDARVRIRTTAGVAA